MSSVVEQVLYLWSLGGGAPAEPGLLYGVRKIDNGVLPGVSWCSSSIREYGYGVTPGGAPVYQGIRVGGLTSAPIYQKLISKERVTSPYLEIWQIQSSGSEAIGRLTPSGLVPDITSCL